MAAALLPEPAAAATPAERQEAAGRCCQTPGACGAGAAAPAVG